MWNIEVQEHERQIALRVTWEGQILAKMGCEDDLLMILHEFASVMLLEVRLGAEQPNAGIRDVITSEITGSSPEASEALG